MFTRISVATILLSFLACSQKDLSDSFGPILVQIDSKKLYASEINKLIHDQVSSYDSAAIANAYIDSWIKDQLLIREAQKYLASDFEIEALVEDYRNQLIGYKYEQQIILNNLERAISEAEIQNYYDENKVNYLLDESIYKVIFASIPDDRKQIDRLYSAWGNDDIDFIKEYCSENADTSFLKTDMWVNADQIFSMVPEKLLDLSRLKVDKTIQKNINSIEYFFKVLELKAPKDTIPLDLIRNKLERVIIHERKQNVIDSYKQGLYEKAMRSNIIKLEID